MRHNDSLLYQKHFRKQFDVEHVGEHLGIDFLDPKIGPVPFGFVHNLTVYNSTSDSAVEVTV